MTQQNKVVMSRHNIIIVIMLKRWVKFVLIHVFAIFCFSPPFYDQLG